MKKFVLIVFVCLLLATTSVDAAILKDNEGFSYMNNYNYLIYSDDFGKPLREVIEKVDEH